MKLEVTRDVINDLWPFYGSGEASTDSRALVEAFLREDPVFAETLNESAKLGTVVPVLRLSPDAERRLLEDARHRAELKLLVTGAVILLLGLVLLGAPLAALLLSAR
jgi:hypothetical protein